MKKILLVEDDNSIREICSEILRLESYDVSTAEDGAVAASLLGAGYRPDLIIMDLLMPNVDGRTFLNRSDLKQLREGIPIIVMSAGVVDDLSDQVVLKKPVDVDMLLGVVECVLRPSGTFRQCVQGDT